MSRRRTKSRSSRSSRELEIVSQAQTQLILREHELSLEVQGQQILTSLLDSLVNNEETFQERLINIGPVISIVVGELRAIAASESGLGIDAQEAIMEINNNIIRFASNESYSPLSFERDCNSALVRIRDNRSIVATAAASLATPTRFTGVGALSAIYMYMFWQQLQAIIQGIITVRNSGLGRIVDVGESAVVVKMVYKKIWDATEPYVATKNVTFPELQQTVALVGMLRSKKLHELGDEILAIANALKSDDKETLRRLLGTGQASQLLPGEEEVLLSTNMPQQLRLTDGRTRLGQTGPRPMDLGGKAKRGAWTVLNNMVRTVKETLVGKTDKHLIKAGAARLEAMGEDTLALSATAERFETLCFTTLISMLVLLVFFLFRKFMSKRSFRKLAEQRRLNFGMKKSRKASRKRRSAKRKASRKRRSAKRKASRKRRSAKRKASRKRRSAKRKASRKRKSAKRKASRKRRSVKRKVSRKRKSAKRKVSRKRRSVKRKVSRKRKSAKRKASRKSKRCPPGCVKRR